MQHGIAILTDAGRTKKSKLYRLSLFTAIGLFIATVSGFLDTVTRSTTGCGKYWPLCNGSLLPQWDNIHTMIEYGHRLIVLVVAVMLIVVSLMALIKYRLNRKVRLALPVAGAGIVIESVLGALSVFFVSPPAIMATHMGVALIAFGAMIILTSAIRESDNPTVTPPKRAAASFVRSAWLTLVFLYLSIYFGGYVASTGEGAVFQGSVFPDEPFSFANRTLWLDFTHRLFALCLFLMICRLVYLSFGTRKQRPDLFKGSLLALILVGLQAVSGMLLVFTHVGLLPYMLHVSNVSLLFGVLCYVSIQSLYRLQVVATPLQKRKETHAKAHALVS